MLFSLKTISFSNNLFRTSEIARNTVEGLAAEGNSDRYIKTRGTENIKYEIKATKTVALDFVSYYKPQFQYK